MQIILLHGALGTPEAVEPLREFLAPHDIYNLGLNGHGRLPRGDHFSIESFADDLYLYIQESGMERPAIFGYSMGGYIALSMASRYPGIAGPIFTLATKFDWSPEQAAIQAAMLNPEKIEAKVPAFASDLARKHGPEWKALCRSTAALMEELGRSKPLALESINTPVMVAVGDQDKMVSADESRFAASKLPNGKLHLFGGMPHPIEKCDISLIASAFMKFVLNN